jgi:hypothetical protein
MDLQKTPPGEGLGHQSNTGELASSMCALPDKPDRSRRCRIANPLPLSLLQPTTSPALPYHIMAAIMNSEKAELAVVSLTEERRRESFGQNVEKELDEPGTLPAKYRGTAADRRDMSILGKKQVLRVCVLPNLISYPSAEELPFRLIDLCSETLGSSLC